MMKRIEKYITIREVPNQKEGKATRVWEVVNKRFGQVIGKVKWYGGWRKYVFYVKGDDPFPEYVSTWFDSDCMREIADLLDKANKEHWEMRKKKI